MKLSLRLGIPLLVLVLIGSSLMEGFERTVLLIVAMAVALWTAFSLPHPRGEAPEPGDGDEDAELEPGEFEAEGEPRAAAQREDQR